MWQIYLEFQNRFIGPQFSLQASATVVNERPLKTVGPSRGLPNGCAEKSGKKADQNDIPVKFVAFTWSLQWTLSSNAHFIGKKGTENWMLICRVQWEAEKPRLPFAHRTTDPSALDIADSTRRTRTMVNTPVHLFEVLAHPSKNFCASKVSLALKRVQRQTPENRSLSLSSQQSPFIFQEDHKNQVNSRNV